MGTRKRLLYFVLLNVVVSALTTFIVVSLLMRNNPSLADLPSPAVEQSNDDGQQTDSSDQDSNSGENLDDRSGESLPVAVGQLEINTIIGAGDLQSERVLVRHIGDQEVSLVGWQLQDEDGNVFYFPALTMFSGGAVTVYSQVGTNTVVEMYWGMEEPVWSVGETASLVDPNGDVQAVFEIP
jgi:hypothetical protein